MIKYSTDISSRGEYRLVFETTNKESFKEIELLAQKLLENYNSKAPELVEEDLVDTFCMEGPNRFKTVYYKPACQYSCEDCIMDPAYIKATYPEWYASLYGEKTPEEAATEERSSCYSCIDCSLYDDEDK